MVNLSCTYCRAPINLSDGDLAQIIQTVDGKRAKSAPVPCPVCRKINKMPFDRLERAWRLAGSPTPPPIAPAQAEETPAADNG